ncbi:MAG: PAS domain S-box protein [Sphingobacteriaceae bacterium]|nr:MAG: PAS domain S-box protein [Sphingobacteriaceae bacterium]
MNIAPEEERLKALFSYQLLDTPPEKQYDAITNLACYICNTKMAVINLIDDHRLWVKAKTGTDICELSKDISFCKYTILQDSLLEIPDTLLDERVKDNPLVTGANGVRFYAGVALINAEGFAIGTVCVFDEKPKKLDEKQRQALLFLAQETVMHMEVFRKNLILEELIEQQQQFQALFNNSSEIHCISDLEGKIVFVNNSVEQILGYTAHEVLGRTILEFCAADDQSVMQKMQESLARGEDRLEFTAKIITKNGELKWFSVNNVNQNGLWLSNGRDVTKQILAEQELQQLSLVASHVTNGVVINDAHNKILWINEAFKTITGYTLEEVKGKKLSNLITGSQSDPQIIEYADHQAKEKKSFTIELLTYKKDQEPIWLSIVNSVILDEHGEINRSIEIIKDITERKKTEYDLQTLSAALKKSEVGVLIRNEKEELVWLNKAAEKLLGWSLYELKGSALDSRFVGELTDIDAYNKAKQDVVDHQPYEVELQIYKKDRTPIWLLIHSTPLRNSEGVAERHLGILMDISTRKAAEQEMARTREEALKLSRAKETFISVLSHEIRTPINAVIGMSRILLEENPAPSQLNHLNVLKFSSENLLKLVNDILDFTKIETGNMQLESAPVNLKELATQTLHTLSFKLENKNLQLVLDLDPQLPELVIADSTRLYQIMMNLLGNAIKFTEKGEVTLSLRLEQENQENVSVRFSIKDTGIGIQDSKLRSIFEAYSQASTDTTRKYGGTGLGLTITKKLIELHQSDIEVQSEFGKGSTFSFKAMFKKAGIQVQKSAHPVIFEPIAAHVLVADDNQINRMLAKKILVKWGIDADFAATGLEAYEMAMVKDYDLILMDLHMPVMDGLEATKLIRKQPLEKYKTIPIIALTGSVFGLDLQNLHQEGLTDHFLKPYTPEGLYNKIKPYLNQPETAA